MRESAGALRRVSRGRQPQDSERPVVITPPSQWPALGLDELWRMRAICWVLARRSLMVRYRQTLIGAAWTLLQPLSMMVVFTIFFGWIARFPTDGIPYPVFVYAGLVVYQLVSKSLMEGSTSVVANSNLVHKIYFPRAYLPISVALTGLVDLAFSGAALAVLLLLHGIVPGPAIVLVPLMIGLVVAASLGVAFWLAALNTEYRDVTQLLPFFTQLWMFASPIIYPSTLIPPEYLGLYWLNPVAVAVDGIRWALAGTPAPPLEAWVIGITVTALVLITGYVFFRKREPRFSDVI